MRKQKGNPETNHFITFVCLNFKGISISGNIFYCFLLFVLALCHTSGAQQVVTGFPVGLTQYNQQLACQNPAAVVSGNKWEASVTNKRYTGFWRNNQTYFAEGAFRIQKDPKRSFHGIGLSVYNDKIGVLLRQYRGYLIYSYHLKINQKYTVSGGLSLGVMSYQVGNSDYDGGTGNGIDGTLGFMFYGPRFYLAASIAQLPESKIIPIGEITLLKRYYQFIAGKNFQVTSDVLVKSSTNIRFLPDKNPDIYLQGGVLWKELVGLYGSYKYKSHASLLLGLEKIEWEGVQLRTYFSYDVPVNGEIKYQTFEITIQCLKPVPKTNGTTKKKRKK